MSEARRPDAHPSAVPAVPYTRWWAAVLCYALAPLALLFLPGHARAIDPAWDFGMALGVFCAGGAAVLPLLSARWWGAQYPSMPFLRLVHDVHAGLAYVLTAFALLHVIVLCLLEPRVLGYLTLAAPWPMLAGIGALLLLVFLCVSSRWRLALGWRQGSWRRWHAGLSALALAGTAWHILDAHYYFNRGSTIAALLWVLAVPTLLALWLRGHPLPRAGNEGGPARPAPRAMRVVMAVGLAWLLGGVLWSGLGSLQAPLREMSPCASNPCL